MTNTIRLMATVGFAALAACGSSATKPQSPADCFSNDECGDGACFLGTCVATGAGLGAVDVDVQPKDNSGALRQRISRLFDAASGSQDLVLAPTVRVAGHITHAGEPLSGTVRAYSVVDGTCTPTSTDDVLSYDGVLTADEITLPIVAGRYRVVVTPTSTSPLPPLAIPNDGSCGIEVADGTRLDVAYPDDASLIAVRGRLRYSVNDTTGVAGAQVTVRTSVGSANFTSATVETNADGTFVVLMPDGGTLYAVDVKAGSNSNVPVYTFVNLNRVNDTLGDLNLGVSALVSVPLTVTDGSGTAVADASVLIQGQVGAGTISITAATNAGGMASLNLRVGTYTVVVLPKRTAQVGLVRSSITIVDGMQAPNLSLVTPPKAEVRGVVYGSDGAPLANARVTYRLRSIRAERDATATTTSDGTYTLLVDTQSPTPTESNAEFEITVEPAVDSREPRHRELVRVDQSPFDHDIGLFPANYVFGKLYTSAGEILPAAALLFYSTFGGQERVLLGVAQSSAAGEFTVPLPSPSFAQ